MVSAPQAPDPWETAGAQAQWNNTTAVTQQGLNMVDQVTPWGSLDYQESGTQTIIGPDGKPTVIPKYTATTALSPGMQSVLDQTTRAQGSLAGLAADQASVVRNSLGQPFSYNPGEHETWALGLYDQLNSDNEARSMEALRTRLANQGVQEGSAAYDAAMRNLMTSTQSARNKFLLDSYGTGIQTALTERNQPINELSALLGNTQVSMPQFTQTPQTGVAGVDYAGQVQNNYAQQTAQHNAMLGGLFGLASAPFQMFSFGG